MEVNSFIDEVEVALAHRRSCGGFAAAPLFLVTAALVLRASMQYRFSGVFGALRSGGF